MTTTYEPSHPRHRPERGLISQSLGALIVVLALTSCNLPPPKASSRQEPKPSTGIVCDRFEVLARLESDQLVLSLDTDLPDQTDIMVSVSRTYHRGSPEKEYPLNYLSTKSTVGEWRKPHKVSVAHSVWQRLLDERARFIASMGEPLKITKTSQDIEAFFGVPIGQSDPRFGKANANLTGSKVSQKGLRVVSTTKPIPYPLSATAAAPTRRYASREALQTGATYEIPKAVPLMPNRKPTTMADINNVSRLPAQTHITVLASDSREPMNLWYRVKAKSPTGNDLGTGWINSSALLGGDIVQVKP